MAAKTTRHWMKQSVLAVHIATAVGLFGVDLCLVLLGALGLAGVQPQRLYPAASLIAALLLRPLALAALATGILLAFLTGWRLFAYWWTTIKLAIAAALLSAAIFILLPAFEAAASAAAMEISPENRLPLFLAPAIASALLAVAIGLSVFKPQWRLNQTR